MKKKQNSLPIGKLKTSHEIKTRHFHPIVAVNFPKITFLEPDGTQATIPWDDERAKPGYYWSGETLSPEEVEALLVNPVEETPRLSEEVLSDLAKELDFKPDVSYPDTWKRLETENWHTAQVSNLSAKTSIFQHKETGAIFRVIQYRVWEDGYTYPNSHIRQVVKKYVLKAVYE